MQHSMKLLEGPFEKIKSGQKTIEIRLYDEKRQQIRVGDSIEFSKSSNLDEKIVVEVMNLYRHPSFRSLVDNFGLEYYGYAPDYPIEDFIESIYTIYTKEEEEKYGVLGIEIKMKSKHLFD